MQKVIVPVAKGFEEIELVSIVDVLRRAQIQVETLSLESNQEVVGAHGITLQTDGLFGAQTYEDCACIALAGGYENMQHMKHHNALGETLQMFKASHKLIAAICASPIVLAHFGILESDFTCYPSCKQEALDSARHTITYHEQRVCFADSILTSQGPATAMEFALRLADIIHSGMQYDIRDGLQHSIVRQVAQNLLV